MRIGTLLLIALVACSLACGSNGSTGPNGANGNPIAGRLVAVSNGQDIARAVPCKVSTRFCDFNR